jgi:hypothetical protein
MSGTQGTQTPLPAGPMRPGMPETGGIGGAQGMQPGAGGLLSPSMWQSSQPPPVPPLRGLMRPTGQPPGHDQIFANLSKGPSDTTLPPDSDESLPGMLRPYAAGLRPTLVPTASPWQQEFVYERLGKPDSEIADIARYYFKIAQNYDTYLSRERITASQYYAGRPLGDEEPGRSQMVLTVVRDTIRATLPSLLRVFTGVEDPVSFEPISSEITGDDKLATTLARQATDYCRWALFTCNPGWQVLHDVLLDALTRKAGWARWHWGKREVTRTEVCENLLLPQLQGLLAEPGIEAQRIIRRPIQPSELQLLAKVPEVAMYLQQGGAPEYWSATLTRHAAQNWPVVEAVPSECVWVVADANTVENARGIFHVRDVPASDLIEMGLPEDKVMRHLDSMMSPLRRREAIARNEASGHNIRGSAPNDRSMQLVRYAEGWIRCDADNDHRAELLHVHMLGNATELVQWERTDEIPLACFTPYREPGRIIGSSQADMVMDLQRTETRVMRAVLDSLGQSMFPRTAVVLGQANLQDVRQTAIGSIIRITQPGAVTELVKPFAGKEALPVMEVLEAVRENRTGITRASQGLSLDQLQSTTPVAVSQQTSAAQDRLDMMARTLAETGLAPLYAGILKMMARQQDRPNVIRLRGEWISIDPRALATMWQTSVNVGGKGMPAERLAMLAQVAAKQEMLIQQGGLNNPLCGVPEYRATLSRMLETINISDVSSYFKPLPPGWQAPPDPQPPPDPSLILAQVQGQKTSADIESQRAEEQTKRADLLSSDDRERSQAALQFWTQAYAVAAQHGTPLPAIGEFQQAMASKAPTVQLLPPSPPPLSPQPPAVGGPQSAPKPPGPPPGPPTPMQGAPGRPQAPMLPQSNLIQPPRGTVDPATQMAIQRGLQGGGLPTAYGGIANAAMKSALFGPGGGTLPKPPGQGAIGA